MDARAISCTDVGYGLLLYTELSSDTYVHCRIDGDNMIRSVDGCSSGQSLE